MGLPDAISKSAMEKHYQEKIEKIVLDYTVMFSQEYSLIVKFIKDTKVFNKTKFAEVGGDNVLDRKLGEYPVTLENLFNVSLNNEEKSYFRSKRGSRWFFKKFNEFAVTVDV